MDKREKEQMQEPLITIAIPAYNNESSISKTIDSCLNQKTQMQYEILIVDDASTDSTPQIIANYNDSKVRIVTLNERVPIMDNHNNCLKHAKGRYVLFCHADDILEDHAIETVYHKIKQRNFPKKYILWGHSLFRDSYSIVKRAGFNVNEMIVGEYAATMFMFGAVAPAGTCYCRDGMLEICGFLQANHRLAPSDITSMIHCAFQGFRFEMMDEMIMIRTHASTATETELDIILESLDDAFKQLIDITTKNNLTALILKSITFRPRPYRFYYALAQDKTFAERIKRIVRKDVLFHPISLKDKMFRQLLKRLYK